MTHNQILSAAAIALTFAGFLPYIRGILRREVRPHVFSWLIWGATTLVVFLAQLAGGAGAGAWPIGVSGLITVYIAALAFARRADTTVTRSDWVFLVFAMTSLPLWYLTADPLWAVVVLTSVDIAGFGPTLRKAYTRPFEENLLFFAVFAVRNVVAISALEHYSLTTTLFPAATGLACVVLIVAVGYRRRVITSP